MGGSLTMMLKGFTALFLISSVCARHFLIETEGDGKKESDAGADSKSSKETESIIQAELESYAELVRDRIKSGSGQAEVKARKKERRKGQDYCHRSPCWSPWR